MVALVLLWRLRFRHLGAWWPLLLAFNGVLLLDPLASLRPGFWLSFAAVAVLIFTFGGRLGAYRDGLAGQASFEDALVRNLYRGDHPGEAALSHGAQRLRYLHRALAGVELDALMAGKLS